MSDIAFHFERARQTLKGLGPQAPPAHITATVMSFYNDIGATFPPISVLMGLKFTRETAIKFMADYDEYNETMIKYSANPAIALQ